MSYCMFENTSADIEQCIGALDENNWDLEELIKEASSRQEARAMISFIDNCIIVADYFNENDFHSSEWVKKIRSLRND